MWNELKKLKFAEIFCLYGFTLCMCFFFYIMYKSFNVKADLPSEVDQIMIAVIGFTGAIVGYVVGSSKSSSDKDATIKSAIEGMPTQPTAGTTTAKSTIEVTETQPTK